MKNLLRYEQPAAAWEKGMPLGNGRLGAMMLGQTDKEHIWLNEDTLWSGYPRDYNDPDAYLYLDEVRRLIFEKEYEKAEYLLNRRMVGCWNESYLPMGDMYLITPELNHTAGYERSLDISRGISRVNIKTSGFTYERTCFCSFPDQVFVIHIHSSKRMEEGMKICLSSQLRHFYQSVDDVLLLNGWCPSLVEPDYYPAQYPVLYEDYETTRAVKFQIQVQVETDGVKKLEKDHITISDYTEVLILVSSANSFLGYDKKPTGDFEGKASAYRKQAQRYTYEQLLERHCKDFSALFDRVELDLGHTHNEELPMEQRQQSFWEGAEDPELIATAFQFGRYLLISSSREGTEPANLQGIWSNEVRPPWSSNYTVNINTQMNYWPAEVCNLSECTQPLLRFISEIAVTGKKTAEINYHCRGFVVHHNVDLWRKTTAVGSREKEVDVLPWSFWTMAGGWFCQHVYQHYLYTGDEKFLLEKGWPVMLECAAFYLDWLVEYKGELITVPSTSPENLFLDQGGVHGVTYGCTLDITIIRELFMNCLKTAEMIEGQRGLTTYEQGLCDEMKNALPKLPPYKIGRHGQLQEWYEDYKENDEEHRHLSLLYGLYPGNDITVEETPDLAQACRVTLERRGEGSVPWSRAWKIAIYARLKDGETAYKEVRRFLQPADSNEISYDDGGVYNNLFCARPLEVDGNLGFSAGVAEMLVQSHMESPQLLPAIPAAWKKGYVKGLKIRGGQQVDIYWDDGIVSNYRIYPENK